MARGVKGALGLCWAGAGLWASISLASLAMALGLSLFAPAARAETHLRVRPGVRAGAGWGSDLFLGGKLGPTTEAQLAPTLRADLSLSPGVKLWGEYAAALGVYQLNLSTSFDQLLAAGARLRLAPSLQAEVAATGQLQNLSAAQAVDDRGLEAVRNTNGGLNAALRSVGERRVYEARYDLTFGLAELESAATVRTVAHLGTLSFKTGIGPLWTTLSARGAREFSGDPSFGYFGGSLHLTLALPVRERALVQALASVHRNQFDRIYVLEGAVLQRIDTFARLGLATTYQLTEAWALEGSYGFALNRTQEDSLKPLFDAERHFVYLGVRLEADVVKF